MTLEQLRVFVAVAEREHVTRAAEALHLTQSAVSAAVASLEARYSVRLFDRVGRHIELTQEGRTFLAEARAVLARVGAAERTFDELSGLERGTLSVQASQTIASYWLPRRLVMFHKAYPQIDIKLLVANTQQVAKAVSEGQAEIGFVEGRVDGSEFALVEVDRDSLVVVVASDHPWAQARTIRPERLRESQWVLRECGSGTRSEFEAALSALGLPPGVLDVALELPSNEAVRAAVEAGAGATAISKLVVEASLNSGTLAEVRFMLPARVFHAVWHRERHRSRTAMALLNMIAGTTTPGAA